MWMTYLISWREKMAIHFDLLQLLSKTRILKLEMKVCVICNWWLDVTNLRFDPTVKIVGGLRGGHNRATLVYYMRNKVTFGAREARETRIS